MRTQKGFTIIEVMVAILVFTVGLLGAYALVKSALSLSLRSKQEILSANLLREEIELVKNVRDTNYLAQRNWNSLGNFPDLCPSASDCELSPGFYTIENAYDDHFPIRLKRMATGFDAKSTVVAEANARLWMSALRLCIDSMGRYTHLCSSAAKGSPYYTYVEVKPVLTTWAPSPFSALEITAHLTTTEGGYREYSMHTVLTDWKK